MKCLSIIAMSAIVFCSVSMAQNIRPCSDWSNDIQFLLQIKELQLLRKIKDDQERRDFEARMERYRYSAKLLK